VRDFCTIVGPPGTGKTTACLSVVREWLGMGIPIEDIAYLAFTRAAAAEAVDRLMREGLVHEGSPTPYFRTIHSLAYRGIRQEMGSDVQVMKTGDWKAFEVETGFEGAYSVYQWEDLADVYANLAGGGRTQWDRCRTAYDISRLSIRRIDQAPLARQKTSRLANIMVPVDGDVYRAFVARYEAFKAREGRVDFADMLYYALLKMRPLERVRCVVVDECQDLSPIMHLVVERVFSPANLIVYAGDADQAIYGFSGADAGLFINKYRESRYKVHLTKTNRFGQNVVDFSQEVIRRVKERIAVPVTGLPGRAHEIRSSGEFKPYPGEALILHRHVAGCREVGKSYIDAGIPFRNERGRDPLGYGARLEAFRAFDRLASGEAASWASIIRMVEELIPSMDASMEGGAPKRRYIVHGAKKRLSENGYQGEATVENLVAAKILTPEGAELIRARKVSTLKHADDLAYYARVLKNGYSLDPAAPPIITTLHGAKGREAPHVVVFDEMGQKCWNDPDTEHRLAYVASSRTKGSLEICSSRLLDWTDTPYSYPRV